MDPRADVPGRKIGGGRVLAVNRKSGREAGEAVRYEQDLQRDPRV